MNGSPPVINTTVCDADVFIYGTHHNDIDNVDDYSNIINNIRIFKPDIVCVESKLNRDTTENYNGDLEAVNEANTDKNEFDIWNIDLYEEKDFKFYEFIENLDESDIDKISGFVNDISEIQELRDNMKDISSKVHKYHSIRESAMCGSIYQAINSYEKVLVVVGAAHIGRIYNFICGVS